MVYLLFFALTYQYSCPIKSRFCGDEISYEILSSCVTHLTQQDYQSELCPFSHLCVIVIYSKSMEHSACHDEHWTGNASVVVMQCNIYLVYKREITWQNCYYIPAVCNKRQILSVWNPSSSGNPCYAYAYYTFWGRDNPWLNFYPLFFGPKANFSWIISLQEGHSIWAGRGVSQPSCIN